MTFAGDILNLKGNEYSGSLRALRREEGRLLHRLKSIVHDSRWVEEIIERLSATPRLAVLANLRCGAWYLPPERLHGTCHFKSTDGHFGKWNFPLSRLNLNVLDSLASHPLVVVIDSTRKGKTYPDAFLRTIPIWVAVVNRVLGLVPLNDPPVLPRDLSPSEADQIRSRIQGWVEQAKACGVRWEESPGASLSSPIEYHLFSRSSPPSHLPSHGLLLLSVSSPDSIATGCERTSFTYVQGAGDDHQTWSRGLGPVLFWKHVKELTHHSLTPNDCDELADEIVQEAGGGQASAEACQMAERRVLQIGAAPLYLADTGSVESSWDTLPPCGWIRVLPCIPASSSHTELLVTDGKAVPCDETEERRVTDSLRMCVVVRENSKKDLERAMPLLVEWGRARLQRKEAMLVSCPTGRGVSVAILVGLAAALGLREDGGVEEGGAVSKDSLRAQLARITTYAPSAAPSRNCMKQLNKYFCS